MKTSAFFGYKCPNCHSTIDVAAIAGNDVLNCPSCGSEMVPNNEGNVVSANVHCDNCDASFGMINSDKCPSCGKDFGKSG